MASVGQSHIAAHPDAALLANMATGGMCVANLAILANLLQKQQDFKHLVQVGQVANLGGKLANLPARMTAARQRHFTSSGSRHTSTVLPAPRRITSSVGP